MNVGKSSDRQEKIRKRERERGGEERVRAMSAWDVSHLPPCRYCKTGWELNCGWRESSLL